MNLWKPSDEDVSIVGIPTGVQVSRRRFDRALDYTLRAARRDGSEVTRLEFSPSYLARRDNSTSANSLQANTDDEDRETPPDQIITAKKFMTAKSSKGSSPMDDGPSYINKSTTKNLADLNLKNQLSGAQGTSSSKSGSVQEFESRKNKFNKPVKACK